MTAAIIVFVWSVGIKTYLEEAIFSYFFFNEQKYHYRKLINDKANKFVNQSRAYSATKRATRFF
jgi:hypothetical protein